MKFRLLLLPLVLITSLFLVSAFESPIYHIGVVIPSSGETGNVITDSNTEDGSHDGDGGGSSRDSSSTSKGNTANLDTGTGNENNAPISAEPTSDEKKGFFPRITGAVIGTVGTAGAIGILIFVIGIIGTVIFIRIKKR